MKAKNLGLAAIVVFLTVAMLSSLSLAQGGIQKQPHHFYGDVLTNGNPAPDSLLVVAKIDGVDVRATTTVGGSYGIEPGEIFYIPDPNNNRAGDLIEFFVNDIKAGEFIFENGRSTNLDLSVTGNFCGDAVCTAGESCSTCSTDCGVCSSPPGGGGGGGSSTTTTCTENWECSGWLDCINGNQERLCVDSNICGTTDDKPVEKQTCVVNVPNTDDDADLCTPGEAVCEGNNRNVCTPEGEFIFAETCTFGCSVTDGSCNPDPNAGNGDSDQGSNPVGDFFSGLAASIAGLFGGASVTGAATGVADASIWSLFGLVILVIVILLLGIAWKFRDKKSKKGTVGSKSKK